MPKKAKLKPRPEGKIEKSGDKEWTEWYNGLDVKEHEKHLAQLGLDKDDIEEWEETEGFKKPENKKKENIASKSNK